VKSGDVLLTSGDDRIFPKGLLIGTVTDAKPALPFQVIHVQPAARLDRLEDVLVLLSQQELEPKKTGEASFPLIPEPPAEASASSAGPAAAAAAAGSGAAPASANPGGPAPKPVASAAQNPPAPAKPPAARQ
jgi:rod shape-determining protein MreC